MPESDLHRPWLVAAWPGMGGVAILAATHLVQALGARRVGDLPAGDYFDVTEVLVKDGLVQPARYPRSVLHAWKSPSPEGRDLVVFLGEAQPTARGYAFAEELVDRAVEMGVSRVVTFAAMASPTHPAAPPRVFAVANGPAVLDHLRHEQVEILPDGQISGLNGVLLAAASSRGVEAACLLGEFPYFATALPNPKASAAVLRVFASLAGLTLELAELDRQATEMEARLTEILERLQQASQGHAAADGEEAPEFPAPAEEGGLSPEDQARIERLFQEATLDRKRALALKAELDRLGAFREYEDRFLDLFKHGG